MDHKSLVTVEDLDNREIEDILDLAVDFNQDLRAHSDLAIGYLMASLFFEPSTRTRGSFESAMKRMGGQTITTADARSSSIEKGESLADTIRVWSGYADLISLRHPWEGAAQLAAEFGHVPIVNAGDGGHEHPTQTLCDLFTLRSEHRSLQGLRVALCGDLKNGRTVHSLTLALLRFGVQIIFIPGEGLELPDHIREKMSSVYGAPIERVQMADIDLHALFHDESAPDATSTFLNAVYMSPSQPHQLTMHQEGVYINVPHTIKPLAIYMTRRQNERANINVQGAYPRVNAKMMKKRTLSDAIVMHPLPRVDELSTDMDSDPRSKYFEQAKNGVPVRMALIALLLGLKKWSIATDLDGTRNNSENLIVSSIDGLSCTNESCATVQEPYNCTTKVLIYLKPIPLFLCRYCERQIKPAYFAYKGKGKYHPLSDLNVKSFDQVSRMRFFESDDVPRREGLTISRSRSSKQGRVIEVTGSGG